MSAKLLLILGVVAGVLLLAFTFAKRDEPAKAVAAEGTLVTAGRFAVEREGVRLLDESYSLLLHPTEGYVLVSQGQIHSGDQTIELAQEATYDRGYRPVSYRLSADTPAGKQTISARQERNAFQMEVRVGLASQSAEVKDAGAAVLLDNNVVSHYVVLLEALRAKALDGTLTVAVPQLLAGLPGKVEGPKEVEFRSGEDVLEGAEFRVHIGDTMIRLVEHDGRLVGLVNETQGTVGFDLEALPGGLEIVEGDKGREVAAGVESNVAFASGDLTLVGTLTLPASGPRPCPAALLIHGSGPLDRDGNALGLRTDIYRQFAEALAASGIASFRFDKRGVGESDGDSTSASRTDFLADAREALAALRAQPEIDGARAILIGHSEGAYLAPILAAEDPTIAGLVLVAGAARSLAEITRWQVETILRLQGTSDEQVAAALAQEDDYLAFVKGSEGAWGDYSVEEMKSAMPWLTEQAASALAASQLSLPWLREHYLDDPRTWLGQVSVPVLVISGEKDLQVPAAEADAIRDALEEGKDPEVMVRVFADLNHLLRLHPEAPGLTYQHLDDPVDPRVLDAITGWAKRYLLE